jgi:hypothetical protein
MSSREIMNAQGFGKPRFDEVLELREEKHDLELRINNLYKEMENDPEIELEGGPVADQYGDELNKLENRLYKVNKQIALYDEF